MRGVVAAVTAVALVCGEGVVVRLDDVTVDPDRRVRKKFLDHVVLLGGGRYGHYQVLSDSPSFNN